MSAPKKTRTVTEKRWAWVQPSGLMVIAEKGHTAASMRACLKPGETVVRVTLTYEVPRG
jgi:hypothetical protein